MTVEVDYKQVYWHSRRGMLELDLILIPFSQQQYPLLSPQDQLLYKALLEEEDQDLFAWLMKRQQPQDVELNRIVGLVLQTSAP